MGSGIDDYDRPSNPSIPADPVLKFTRTTMPDREVGLLLCPRCGSSQVAITTLRARVRDQTPASDFEVELDFNRGKMLVGRGYRPHLDGVEMRVACASCQGDSVIDIGHEDGTTQIAWR